MLDSLDAVAIRQWCAAGLAALRHHQREIDDLNVFPVPDSDTGTNLVLTLEAADRALHTEPDLTDLGAVVRCMAKGALLGARGNSGVIIAQLLRGVADSLVVGHGPARGNRLAAALRNAADAGYAAVAAPAEGTVLTVARAAADAATACDSDDLHTVMLAAVREAELALARTPLQLDVLATAGVVDAGGRGLCLLLRALGDVVAAPVTSSAEGMPSWFARPASPVANHPPLAVARESGSVEFQYEVQYLLDAAEPEVANLRADLSALGDSLVIVGTGDGSWNVHVHVNDVGAAVEAGVVAGRPYQIRVTRFADEPPTTRTVVAFAEGAGLVELLESEGARVVSTLDGLTGQVIALGGSPRARVPGCDLRTIPLRSPVQALAALAVHDPGQQFDDDVIAMAEAAGACRSAEITIATRDALTLAGACHAGDIVVLVDGEVNLIGHDLITAAITVLDRLLTAGGELVTLLVGAEAPEDLGATVEKHLARRWPFVEARSYHGGQPQPLLVGVE